MVTGAFAPAARAVEDGSALWLGVTRNGFFDEDAERRKLWTLQVDYRAFDALEGARQVVGRAGIGHRFDNGLRLWLRAGYVHADSDSTGTLREVRGEQLAYLPLGRLGDAQVSLRAMLEQRRLEHRDGTAWRLRARLRFEGPLIPEKAVDWVAWVEPFQSLNSTVWTRSGWNQNRIFLGVNVTLAQDLNLEAGYQHQWLNPLETGDQVNHTLLAVLRIR